VGSDRDAWVDVFIKKRACSPEYLGMRQCQGLLSRKKQYRKYPGTRHTNVSSQI